MRRLSMPGDRLHLSIELSKIQINNFDMFDVNWQGIRISEQTFVSPSLQKGKTTQQVNGYIFERAHAHPHMVHCQYKGSNIT